MNTDIKQFDTATIVDIYKGGEAYELEIFDPRTNESKGVVTLYGTQSRNQLIEEFCKDIDRLTNDFADDKLRVRSFDNVKAKYLQKESSI